MIIEDDVLPCLWEKLRGESRPIFLYGTGNGADKILDVCSRYEIEIKGIFASSGFVRNRSFRGMPVRSIEDIRAEFGDYIIVLLAFGTTLDSVVANINKIASKHTLYIPEVPLYDSALFDRDYYLKNRSAINEAEELFHDEESREVFRDMISFRLSGEGKYLSRVATPVEMYSSLIDKSTVNKVIDCGAYKGDSAVDIISALNPQEIIALEPDPKTFLKLSAFCDTVKDCKITPLNYAVGDSCAVTEFSSSGSRGSGAEGTNKRARTTSVEIRSLDSLGIESVDLIKYDVEGDELAAINGSLKIINRCSPALSISVYHRSEDIFEIPLLINKLCPNHRLYMRRVPCIPAWDISLLAIPENMAK